MAQHEALCEAFTISAVHVAFCLMAQGAHLAWKSLSRLAFVAVDGVTAGDFDQNIPAWDMGYDFFSAYLRPQLRIVCSIYFGGMMRAHSRRAYGSQYC